MAPCSTTHHWAGAKMPAEDIEESTVTSFEPEVIRTEPVRGDDDDNK